MAKQRLGGHHAQKPRSLRRPPPYRSSSRRNHNSSAPHHRLGRDNLRLPKRLPDLPPALQRLPPSGFNPYPHQTQHPLPHLSPYPRKARTQYHQYNIQDQACHHPPHPHHNPQTGAVSCRIETLWNRIKLRSVGLYLFLLRLVIHSVSLARQHFLFWDILSVCPFSAYHCYL